MAFNEPAPNTPYFTPAQIPAAGSAAQSNGKEIPKLFQSIKIRGLEFQNRVFVGNPHRLSLLSLTSPCIPVVSYVSIFCG
jgi:hypothetical protein